MIHPIKWLKRQIQKLKEWFTPSMGECPRCGGKLIEFDATNSGHLVGCTKCDWDERMRRRRLTDSERMRIISSRRPRRAVDQNIGRFMKKHGRQSKEYRTSIKRRIQPEEDED